MKKNVLPIILLILVKLISAQDVIINLCPLQEEKAVSVDVINIYNETNASTLQLTNLPQNVNEYAINLTQGDLNNVTGSSDIELETEAPVRIIRTNGAIQLITNLSNEQDVFIRIFSLDGKLLFNKTYSAIHGENTFEIPVFRNKLCLVQVKSHDLNKAYKISEQSIGEFKSSDFTVTNKSGILKSAASFSYSPGDRIHFTVTKNNLLSRIWMGKPSHGDEIRLAIPKNDRKFDMAQTLSKGAQEHTISYSGVAFYTGCFYASTFYPPGKVADYFGFQYFRDNDPDEGGHNTDFLTKAAYHTIHLLNDEQLGVLIELAEKQDSLIAAYAYARMPVIKAFHRYLDNDIPSGKTKLSKEAVINESKEIYLIDAELSYGRAKAFSTVIKSLTQEQKDYLYALDAIGMRLWSMPEKPKDRGIPRGLNTHVMTNASEMFSWFLGSPEADTYFCPERQGTYFGGFFMKDAPAMGNPDYSIDMETTADKGRYMLEEILDNEQGSKIRGIYTTVGNDLDSITAVREEISIELRKFWEQDEIDKQKVLDLSAKYGEFDGNYIYTMADQFVDVARTLTNQQMDTLIWLRELEDFPCKEGTVFLYSKEITEPSIENTDKFFE